MNTVLLIDKDPRALRALSRMLRRFSERSDRKPQTVVFQTALGPARGVDFLLKHPVDLVVMNIEVAGAQHVQYMAQIQKARPRAGICVMSHLANDPRFEACLDAGALRVLDLPFNRTNVLPIFGAIMDALQQAINNSERDESGSSVRDAVHLRGLRGESCILMVEAMSISGRIFLSEGQIVHAEAGTLTGVIALRRLLSEIDAYVSIADYVPPVRMTITPGLWEYLHDSPVEKDNTPPVARVERPEVPTIKARTPDWKLSRFSLSRPASAAEETGPDHHSSEKAWPGHLHHVVISSGNNLTIDSVGSDDSSVIRNLMQYVQERSAQIAQSLKLPPSGQLEFVGSESRALVTFGSDSQGFAVTSDRHQPPARIAEALLRLAQADGGGQ